MLFFEKSLSILLNVGAEMEYYFRVEAVNLYNTIFDTNDISTTRGGSFLLLNAVERLKELDRLEPISIGASAGLFKGNDVSDENEAEQVKVLISEKLKSIAADATFVIDYLKSNSKGNAQEIIKKLISLNRFSQFKQSTIIPPDTEEKLFEQKQDEIVEIDGKTKASLQCSKDGYRPGIVSVYSPGMNEKVWLSKWTYLRREKGKELRQKLFWKIYQETIKFAPELKLSFNEQTTQNIIFTDDLEKLSYAPEKGNLNGKIAFIYFDGNSFGKIRDRTCKNMELLKKFDEVLQQQLRGKIFLNLIEHALNNNDFMYYDKNSQQEKIRLETLLWGGDEVEWVVPAWNAWDVLKTFFNNKLEFGDYPLTHACGVVFCHHNAPIKEIRNLAHKLADNAKKHLKTDSGGEPPKSHEQGNVIQYLALESFDNITQSMETFSKRYYNVPDLSALMINTSELYSLEKSLKTIIKYFPHTKVYEIIERLKLGGNQSKTIENIINRGLDGLDAKRQKEVKKAIMSILGIKKNQIKWFMIADLWDYIAYSKGGA